jgi:hypothetical protein
VCSCQKQEVEDPNCGGRDLCMISVSILKRFSRPTVEQGTSKQKNWGC